MTALRRALLPAPLPACILALLAFLPATGRAQATNPRPINALPVLPTVRARPPATRVPLAATPAQPARGTLVRRPAVQPALTPTAPLLDAKVPANGETLTQMTRETVNGGRQLYPAGPGLKGASVLRVQVLLDRVLFSPGMIDGSWGKNTSIAVYWFQAREGLTPTGVVDSATFARLHFLAARPTEYVVRRVLTAEDVRGPFVTIPGNIYEHANLRCSCYESLAEKLSETFHARVELLRQLNPGVTLNRLKAGDAINIPNVRDPQAPARGVVSTLVVSGADHYLQALDGNGRILYQFPITLGSTYNPSPEGNFYVLAITENPWWHYQPAILRNGKEGQPNAYIPPGPNNAVGRVWMTLSAEHYGIHGTKSPETIGYAVSAGCVRLANWDALYLARRLTPGTPVVFRGTRTGPAAPARAAVTQPAPARPGLAGVRADSAAGDSTRRDSVRAPAQDSARRDSAPSAPARQDSTARPPAPAPAPAPPPPPAPAPAQPDSTGRP
jgi:lipoprotein-anchoring transpeptidase ErfK/SrfK